MAKTEKTEKVGKPKVALVHATGKLYDRAYHEGIEREERPFAHALCAYLREKYAPESVADFGCSTGVYLEPWPSGAPTIGYESSRAAVRHRIDPRVVYHDLTQPLPRGSAWALGVCLEVLEHVPEELAKDVIRTITAGVRERIVFSAAIPGQGGVGHINCQEKPYWIDLFEKRGWIVDYPETVSMLGAIARGPHMGWFTQNAMVLRPYGGPGARQ